MNCIIVHGASFYDREKIAKGEDTINKRFWIPWIKRELEKRRIKTETPLMPRNWDPKYEDWKKEIEKLYINKETILIGTSAGAAFLTRWLGETKIKVNKLILIAPAKICPDFYEESFKNFYNFKIDKTINDGIKEIIIFTSDNDSEDILKSVEEYSNILGIKPILIKGAGHFTDNYVSKKRVP